MLDKSSSFGVALSGGASRGFAHIGVMQAFEEAGARPSALAGTSAGSVVAALWAAGWSSARAREFGMDLRWTDVLRPVLPRRGLFSIEPLGELLGDALGTVTFEELRIPLAVVACDITTAQRVVIREGEVVPAILASCAVPVVFEPVALGGRTLVDGGVVENVPAEACAALTSGQVVAVDLLWKRWETFDPDSLSGIALRVLTMFYSAQDPVGHLGAGRLTMIRPDLSAFPPTSLNDRDGMIDAGYRAAAEFLRGA